MNEAEQATSQHGHQWLSSQRTLAKNAAAGLSPCTAAEKHVEACTASVETPDNMPRGGADQQELMQALKLMSGPRTRFCSALCFAALLVDSVL